MNAHGFIGFYLIGITLRQVKGSFDLLVR